MVSCNQLRVGNYIMIDDNVQKVNMINNDRGFDEVASIGYEGDALSGYASCESDRVQPIQLSKDILIQCGFIFIDHFNFWQKVTFHNGRKREMDIDNDFNVLDFMRRPLVRKLTSLHQLQNLYFALEEREMDVKLNSDILLQIERRNRKSEKEPRPVFADTGQPSTTSGLK